MTEIWKPKIGEQVLILHEWAPGENHDGIFPDRAGKTAPIVAVWEDDPDYPYTVHIDGYETLVHCVAQIPASEDAAALNSPLLTGAIYNTYMISETDPKIPLETAAKLTEEVGELMREVLIDNRTPGTTYRKTSKEAQTEELADVLLCAFSLAQKLGITCDQLALSMNVKAKKWKSNLRKK